MSPDLRSSFPRSGTGLANISEVPEKLPSVRFKELFDLISQILSQEWSNSTLKLFEKTLKEIYDIED